MQNPNRLRSTISVLFLSFAAILFLIQAIDFLNFGVDDVFISLRVVENVVTHNGFVYNIGEHVEGYSNWLWVVLLSIPAAAGVTQSSSAFELMWVAKALSFFFGLATLATLYVLAKRVFADSEWAKVFASLAVVLGCSCAPMVVWSVGGLETTFCAFLYTFAALQAFHILGAADRGEGSATSRYLLFGFALALTCLVRPEPLLHALVAIAFVYFCIRKRGPNIFLFASVLPFAAIVIAFLAWRWSYYGEFVPNTFYAKTGGGAASYIRGIKYAFGGIAAIAGPALAVIPLVVAGRTKARAFVAYAVLLVSTTVVFTLYSGGDWMQGYRFFIPVAPLLFLLGAMGIEAAYARYLDRARTVMHALVIAAVVCTMAAATAFFDRVYLRATMPGLQTGFSEQRGYLIDTRDSVVQWFNSHNTKPYTVVSGEAGYIGYFSHDLRLIDVNGLFDKTIARMIKHHTPFNPDYIFDRRPEYVLLFALNLNSDKIGDTSPASANLLVLIKEPRFLEQYELVKTFPGFEIIARKDIAAGLK